MNNSGMHTEQGNSSGLSFITTLFLASSVSFLLYTLFYYYSPFIWSFNGNLLPISEYTPWVRWCAVERDGIETYVLYVLMFFNIAIMLLLNNFFSRFNSRSLRNYFTLIFGFISILYYMRIGFNVPMAEIASGFPCACFIFGVLCITLGLTLLTEKIPKLTSLIIIISLIPVCMISTAEIQFPDTGFIFSPALRILHGFKLSQTYFQYDYLFSLLAAVWMKLHFPIYTFKIVGQFSYYLLFIGIYFLAKKYFINKRLALYLLISLVIVRIYGNMRDPISFLQVAPLRLDLWLAVLIAAYHKGLRHWVTGLTLGFLVVFSHNFGLIYAFSYLLAIVILYIFETTHQKCVLTDRLRNFFHAYIINILLIIISLAIYKTLSGANIENAAYRFQKTGMGFLPTAENSFYWYMPVIFSLIFALIINNRKTLPLRYFQTSVLLIILAIGNSLYFFGRSHEHNIINISGSLLLSLFLLLDLLGFRAGRKRSTKIMACGVLPIIIILVIAYSYSGRAIDRINEQYANFEDRRLLSPVRLYVDTPSLQKLTLANKNVIFLSRLDFFYYYKGGYTPPDYYALIDARWFLKDTVGFLNAWLADGYYVIMPLKEYNMFSDIVKNLNAKNIKKVYGFLVISNNNIG